MIYTTKSDDLYAMYMMYQDIILEKNKQIMTDDILEYNRNHIWWSAYGGTAEFDYSTGVISHHEWRQY